MFDYLASLCSRGESFFIRHRLLCGLLLVLSPVAAKAEVTSSGGFLEYQGTAFVGYPNDGSLTVSAGSAYVINFLEAGYTAGYTGVVTLTGTGSTITTGNSVFIGVNGVGTLDILDGAVMTSNGSASVGGITVGDNNGSTGTVNVDGTGSQWFITNMNMVLGAFAGSTGSLSIRNGGNVTFGTGQVNVAGGGTLLVTGTGSLLNMLSGAQFITSSPVATGATPMLATTTVSAGGVINSAGNNYIGFANLGAATVTGTGSQWNIAGSLNVGIGSGTGTLTVADGAVLSVSSTGTPNESGTGFAGIAGDGALIVGSSTYTNVGSPPSKGTLNIGSYDLSAPTTAGVLNVGSIVVGMAQGVVNFNQIDTFTLSAPVSGNGSLVQRGSGVTVLGGDNSYSGGTTIRAGTLRAAHDNALGSGTVSITGGALEVQEGVALANSVKLAGGSYSRTLTGNLAGAVNAASELGGIDTSASILAGNTATSVTLTTSFSLSSAATNDELRLSDVYHIDGTGNAIAAVSLLLRKLELSSRIVTLDAMGCQKNIAKEIHEADADYVLALKDNQQARGAIAPMARTDLANQFF
jgi:T5SS/PEP-CTERM-associated repeat protein/autotransporter-associated beta strand protein